MAGDNRLIKILELLARLTRAGILEWDSVGTVEEPRFATSFTDASFVVYSQDNDGAHPFVVELRNDRGEVLETIRSKTIRPVRREKSLADEDERQRNREFNKSLYDLYNDARRNAMNVDQFLDGVLAQLQAQARDSGSS